MLWVRNEETNVDGINIRSHTTRHNTVLVVVVGLVSLERRSEIIMRGSSSSLFARTSYSNPNGHKTHNQHTFWNIYLFVRIVFASVQQFISFCVFFLLS